MAPLKADWGWRLAHVLTWGYFPLTTLRIYHLIHILLAFDSVSIIETEFIQVLPLFHSLKIIVIGWPTSVFLPLGNVGSVFITRGFYCNLFHVLPMFKLSFDSTLLGGFKAAHAPYLWSFSRSPLGIHASGPSGTLFHWPGIASLIFQLGEIRVKF